MSPAIEELMQLAVERADPQLLVWDTETTGLTLHPDAAPHKQPKIIEFGAVLLSLKTGEVTYECAKLIHPGEPISAEITGITGITDDMVREQPSFRERLPFLRALFASARAHVAHNLPFDRDMLRWELVRHSSDTLSQEFPWPKKEFCTMNLYTPRWGRPPRLVEVYESVMGAKYPQTHRALDDVKAMVDIIQRDALWELMT